MKNDIHKYTRDSNMSLDRKIELFKHRMRDHFVARREPLVQKCKPLPVVIQRPMMTVWEEERG